MAMKMPALRASRAFVKEHCGDAGAVSLALGGEQRRTKAHVVTELSCGHGWRVGVTRRDPWAGTIDCAVARADYQRGLQTQQRFKSEDPVCLTESGL